MNKNLWKKMEMNSFSGQSSEDKAIFMSAPDIMLYADHQENKPAAEREQVQVHSFPMI